MCLIQKIIFVFSRISNFFFTQYSFFAQKIPHNCQSTTVIQYKHLKLFSPYFRLTPRNRLPGISEVLPSLYLCGAGVAIPCFLEKLSITCVVNAAPELPDTPLPDTKPLYYQVPILDRGDNDLQCYFDEVADLLEQVRQSDGISLVHCVAGVSRSASLCIAYLMKHTGMTLREAFAHVRSVRYALQNYLLL